MYSLPYQVLQVRQDLYIFVTLWTYQINQYIYIISSFIMVSELLRSWALHKHQNPKTLSKTMTGEELKPQADATSSQKVPAWENINNPLYIHHSDQPGAILVPQSLMEDNFSAWIESMKMALQIKNKIGLVDGTLTKPVKNPDEQNQWNWCNILVKTWLLASMSKEISKSFSHCKDARTVWLELYERFGQTNTVQLFHIENAIHDCTQGSSSVTSFFTQLKSLWDEKEALCNFPACVCDAGEELKSYIET